MPAKDLDQLVVPPLFFVPQLRFHVVEWQDQIVTSEFPLVLKEKPHLGAVLIAVEEAGGDDRDEMRHLVEGVPDAPLPILALFDVGSVQEDLEKSCP